jgi:DNA polymerase-3 subunit alpha
LRSLTTVDFLVDRVAELGMTAVALTDEDVLSGALHFYNRCFATRSASGEPIKPIIGCDFSIYTSRLGPSKQSDECDPFARIVLIALNVAGMRHLIRLSTETWRNGRDRPAPLTRDELEASADNLLLLTGRTNGVLARLVRSVTIWRLGMSCRSLPDLKNGQHTSAPPSRSCKKSVPPKGSM